MRSTENACLRNCRAPAHFMSRYWHTGNFGAFRMGLRLGAYWSRRSHSVTWVEGSRAWRS
ncbi:DUF2182 domain-containing protein [Nocardia sp. NEAU-G5]|uniref:DUF2182 domain-containing protein n=1 Tax=Nocardia albiluteola TaxID=2842303 RepID=A0ABS6ARD6_9NOCA|nr:DUF2182 domain-containing protein [Nocardia albiluteola]